MPANLRPVTAIRFGWLLLGVMLGHLVLSVVDRSIAIWVLRSAPHLRYGPLETIGERGDAIWYLVPSALVAACGLVGAQVSKSDAARAALRCRVDRDYTLYGSGAFPVRPGRRRGLAIATTYWLRNLFASSDASRDETSKAPCVSPLCITKAAASLCFCLPSLHINPLAGLWRRGGDSNPRWACTHAAFRVRCIQPLCHLSGVVVGV